MLANIYFKNLKSKSTGVCFASKIWLFCTPYNTRQNVYRNNAVYCVVHVNHPVNINLYFRTCACLYEDVLHKSQLLLVTLNHDL